MIAAVKNVASSAAAISQRNPNRLSSPSAPTRRNAAAPLCVGAALVRAILVSLRILLGASAERLFEAF